MHYNSKLRLVPLLMIAIAMAPADLFGQSGTRAPTGTRSAPGSGTSTAATSNGSSTRTARAPLALHGYCPVCLVEMRQWVKGDSQFASVYDGRTYYFPGSEQLQMFTADPAKYIPVLGGDDIVAYATSEKRVAGNPKFGVVHDGKYYFFSSAENMKKFQESPQTYVDADLAIGGECIVCRVDMKQHVAGTPSITATYKGIRYQFPGEEQKEMFLKSPSRYVRAIEAPAATSSGGSQTRPWSATSQPSQPRQSVGGSGTR